jgi:hypothetical protein
VGPNQSVISNNHTNQIDQDSPSVRAASIAARAGRVSALLRPPKVKLYVHCHVGQLDDLDTNAPTRPTPSSAKSPI